MIQIKLKLCAGCNQQKHIWKSEGKDKYCKECWYQNQPLKSMTKPTRINRVSMKMKSDNEKYSELRIAYLTLNGSCKARLVGCTRTATDVHHKAGRGASYLKIITWLPVCRSCHSWIEMHPVEAKELGLSESRLNNKI